MTQQPLPTDPPALLEYVLERMNERLVELTAAGSLSQEGLDELQRLAGAIATPLSRTDVRSRWREFMSARDIGYLRQLLRRLQHEAVQARVPGEPLVRLLEQVVDQIKWCLEGLGIESDSRVLRNHLVEAIESDDIQRQLRIVERLADVLDNLYRQTGQRLNEVVAVRPRGTSAERRRQLEILAELQTGLVGIFNRSAEAMDALRPYRNMLHPGGDTDMLIRNRVVFLQALARVLTALDQPLPPLPPGVEPM